MTAIAEPPKKTKGFTSDQVETIQARHLKLQQHDKNYCRQYHQLWFALIAFLNGHQWGDWHPRLGYAPYHPYLVTPEQRFITINRIRPKYSTMLAKLTSNVRVPVVERETIDDEDAMGAHVGQAAVIHEWRRVRMPELRTEAAAWITATGNYFFKKTWDPNAGETHIIPVSDPETGRPVTDPETGEPMFQEVVSGDNRVEGLSPFRLTWPAGTRNVRDAWEVEEHKTMSRDFAVSEYPQFKEQIESAAKSEASPMLYEQLLAHLQPASETIVTSLSTSDEDVVEIHELNILPGKLDDLPDGCLALFAGDKYLDAVKSPFGEEGRLPFYHAIFRKRHGNLYGEGMIEPMLPIQEVYNRFWTHIYQWTRRTANPILLNPHTSGFDPAAITTAGGVAKYNYGHEPKYLDPPQPPAHIFNLMDRLDVLIDVIPGIQRVSEGRYPTSIKSGVAIGIVREQDDLDIQPILANLDGCIQELMNDMLQDTVTKWTLPRKIQTVGRKLSALIPPEITGDMISKNIQVIIPSGEGATRTNTEKLQVLIDLADSEVIPKDEELERQIRELLGIGSGIAYIPSTVQDEGRARRENLLFQDAEKFGEPHAEIYDDEAVHMPILDELRKSLWFEKEANDDQIQAIEIHAQMHERNAIQKRIDPALDEARVQLAMQQMIPQEGVTPGGEPSEQAAQPAAPEAAPPGAYE